MFCETYSVLTLPAFEVRIFLLRYSFKKEHAELSEQNRTAATVSACHLNRGFSHHGEEARHNVANDDSSSCSASAAGDAEDYGYGPGGEGVGGRSDNEGFGGTLTIR